MIKKVKLIGLLFILLIITLPAAAQDLPVNPYQQRVWDFEREFNQRIQSVSKYISAELTRTKAPALDTYGTWKVSYINQPDLVANYVYVYLLTKDYSDDYTAVWFHTFTEDEVNQYNRDKTIKSCPIVTSGDYWLIVYIGFAVGDFACLEYPFIIADDASHTSLDEKITQIVNECRASTSWQTALNLHDWLTHHLHYDLTLQYYGVDGILRGYGVCDAYSKAYLMLCKKAGIPVGRVIGSRSGGSSHAWNAIQLNGNWYYVDVTWDDPVIRSSNQNVPVSGYERHYYFCLNEDTILTDHEIKERDNNIGSCTLMDMQYYIYTGQWETWLITKADRDGGILIDNKAEALENDEPTIIINDGTINGARAYTVLNEGTGKVEINGGSLSSSDLIVYNKAGGTVEINNGSLSGSGDSRGITNENGTIIFNNGVFDGQYGEITNYAGQTVIINNGELRGGITNYGIFKMYGGSISRPQYSTTVTNNSEMYIYGGTISNTSTERNKYGEPTSKVIENAGTLELGTKGDEEVSTESPLIYSNLNLGILTTGTFKWYDGKVKGGRKAISRAPDEIEDTYQIIQSSDATYKEIKYLGKAAIVKIGEDRYNTIEEAVASSNCNNQCEIELLRDATLLTTQETITIPNNKDITFDIAGYKIMTSGESLFTNNGTLEIKDSVGTGILTSTSNKIVENNKDLTITAGTLETETSLIIKNNEGSTFTEESNAKINGSIENTNAKDIVIKGTTGGINNSSETITFDGATTGNVNVTEGSLEVKDSTTGNVNVTEGSLEVKNSTTGALSMGINVESTIYSGTISSITNAGTLEIKESENNIKLGTTINTGTINVNGGNIIGIANLFDGLISNRGIFNFNNGNIVASSYYLIYNSGTMNISGGKITNTDGSVQDYYKNPYGINNTGILNITGGEISNNNQNLIINSNELMINNVVLTAAMDGISNTGAGLVNLENVTINSGIRGISNTGTGTVNVKENVTINSSNTGISNTGAGTINLGIQKQVPSDSNPVVEGTQYGINNTNGTVNFNEGKIIGSVTKSIAGTINPLSGYKVKTTTDSEVNKDISILEIDATVERVVEMNGNVFMDLQAAVNSAIGNSNNTMKLYKNITLENNITVPDNAIITIDTSTGYRIDLNGFSFVGNNIEVKYDDGVSLLGAIRELLNIGDIKVRKNIVVYNNDNGNLLNSGEIYTLKLKVNNGYEEIDVKEEVDNIGRYEIASKASDDKIRSINGNVYIKNIPNGEYVLEGSNGSRATFVITDEGKVKGTAKETYLEKEYGTKNTLAMSSANLIVGIQTGQKVVRYGIIIFTLASLISLLLIIKKKAKI